MPDREALDILLDLKFKILPLDIVGCARGLIGFARYRRGALIGDAPGTVDCSLFVKWVYGQSGIEIPRRTIQQVMDKRWVPVKREAFAVGDLVYTSGWHDWYDVNPAQGVGHVGIVTGSGTIIHAVNRGRGVVEDPGDEFFARSEFRTARRILPRNREIVVFEVPPTVDVESSDDLRWIIVQRAIRPAR